MIASSSGSRPLSRRARNGGRNGEAPERAAGHRAQSPPAPKSVVVSGPMARRHPKPDRRRALELLAASNDGATEAIMAAHGFTVEQLVELVRSGLASATPERVVAGKRAMQITRVRITEAGRRALAGEP